MTTNAPRQSITLRILATFRLIIAAVFLTAAASKLIAFSGDLPSQYFYFFHPAFFAFAVALEIVFGCWMLVSPVSREMAISCALLFVFLGVFAAWGTLHGKPNCGCFGAIPTPPWWMLVFDVGGFLGCLLALRWCKSNAQIPQGATDDLMRNQHSRVMKIATLVAVFVLPLAGVVVGNALSALTRDELYAVPSSTNFGDLVAGENESREVLFRNPSNVPLTILGIKATCACILETELPQSILPGEMIAFRISINVPDSRATVEFRRELIVWTDSKTNPKFAVKLFGWIRQTESSNQVVKEVGNPRI